MPRVRTTKEKLTPDALLFSGDKSSDRPSSKAGKVSQRKPATINRAPERVTSRFFPTPSETFQQTDRGAANATPRTTPIVRRLPRTQVEVVIPPYPTKRKFQQDEDAAVPKPALHKLPDLSKFAYISPKPTRPKPAIVRSEPAEGPVVSRFFSGSASQPIASRTVASGKSKASVVEPVTPSKPKSRKRKASTSLESDLNNEKKIKLDICECKTIQEHLLAAKPKLVQAVVANDPWKMIIAVSLLNKTSGALAIPVFWRIVRQWENAKALSEASPAVLAEIMRGLGLQNTRAERFIQMSLKYLDDPVVVNTLRMKKTEPRYPPTPISHLPGVGRYALDSFRIFSPTYFGGGAPRYENECLENLLSAPETESEEQEWRKVYPEDKELRKYLIWRWALEGSRWEPEKGITGRLELSDLWTLPHWS